MIRHCSECGERFESDQPKRLYCVYHATTYASTQRWKVNNGKRSVMITLDVDVVAAADAYCARWSKTHDPLSRSKLIETLLKKALKI